MSANDCDSEASLVDAAHHGDRGALGQLLVRHANDLGRRVEARMPRSLGRVVSVDDILQQAYADAFRDIASFEWRGTGSFFAWLDAIAQRRLKNAITSAGRLKRGGQRNQFDPPSGAVASVRDLLGQVAGPEITASTAAVQGEAVSALNVAVSQLPEDYREVVRLRFFEQQSIEETAHQMNRTPAAVRSLLDRAKQRLRALLADLSSRR